MIDAYLDETGIHDGAPMCFVTGFFGGRGQWKKVADSWRRVLDRFEVPLDQFHALNAVKRRKLFGKMDGRTHARFMLDLSQAIIDFKVCPVSYGVVVSDFYIFTEKERRFLTGMEITPDRKLTGTGNPNKPYFMPFLHVVRTVASYAPKGGLAHFFVGVERPFYGYAKDMFDVLKNGPNTGNYRERLGNIDAPLAKETPQLQAADFFAYMTYDRARDCLASGNWFKPSIPALDVLTRKARSVDDLVFYNRETITGMLGQIDPVSRLLLK
jgi:hypothetical protein